MIELDIEAPDAAKIARRLSSVSPDARKLVRRNMARNVAAARKSIRPLVPKSGRRHPGGKPLRSTVRSSVQFRHGGQTIIASVKAGHSGGSGWYGQILNSRTRMGAGAKGRTRPASPVLFWQRGFRRAGGTEDGRKVLADAVYDGWNAALRRNFKDV